MMNQNPKNATIRCRNWEFLPCGAAVSAKGAIQDFMKFRDNPFQERFKPQHDFVIAGRFTGLSATCSAQVVELSRIGNRLDQGLEGLTYRVTTVDGATFMIDERDMGHAQLLHMHYARSNGAHSLAI